MANYAILKAAVQNAIKENGNNEITGSLLQNALLSIINALGAGKIFIGVAIPSTNPGTPDGNVFYFAKEPGTYPNFGGAVVEDKQLVLFQWSGSGWGMTNLLPSGIISGGDEADLQSVTAEQITGRFVDGEDVSGEQIIVRDELTQTRSETGKTHARITYTANEQSQYEFEEFALPETGGQLTTRTDIPGIAGMSKGAGGNSAQQRGAGAKASTLGSFVTGQQTRVSNDYERAGGRYNKTNTNTADSFGIGTGENLRRNAYEVMSGGGIYLFGIGGYDGTNAGGVGVKTVQQVIQELQQAVANQ